MQEGWQGERRCIFQVTYFNQLCHVDISYACGATKSLKKLQRDFMLGSVEDLKRFHVIDPCDKFGEDLFPNSVRWIGCLQPS